MTSSLCPHLFKQYTVKVSEVLETYKPQILLKVKFEDISDGLLAYRTIKRKEILRIGQFASNPDKIRHVLEVITGRMWGLETFITVLMDRNADSWLTEELFQAYTRHVVGHLKQVQSKNSCSCFQAERNSRMYQKWISALEAFDRYLHQMRTSYNFLTLTIYPIDTLISQMLTVQKEGSSTAFYEVGHLESDSSVYEEIDDNSTGPHVSLTAGCTTHETDYLQRCPAIYEPRSTLANDQVNRVVDQLESISIQENEGTHLLSENGNGGSFTPTPGIPQRKPNCLTGKCQNSVNIPPRTKMTTTITPRQRVIQEFRSKKTNKQPPLTLPSKQDQRLSPQNYNSPQWSQRRLKRQDGSNGRSGIQF